LVKLQCVRFRLYGKNGIRGSKDRQKYDTEIKKKIVVRIIGLIALVTSYDEHTM
jgi:hypothetical protein